MLRHYNGGSALQQSCLFPELRPLLHSMRRIVIGGMALLLGGAIAARGKTESLLFVFLRVDHKQDVAILRPMIAPDIGVQLDSGPGQLTPARCSRARCFRANTTPSSRARSARSARSC